MPASKRKGEPAGPAKLARCRKGAKAERKPASKKRGKAEPLLGAAWAAFLQHLANTGPTWALIALSLAHLLCCRITEVLRLQLQDINWEDKKIRIRELKGHAEMMKPLSRAAVLFLEKLKAENGRKISRTRMWGNRGLVTFMDWWRFPINPEGHLFPPSRKDCATAHRNKATWQSWGFFTLCARPSPSSTCHNIRIDHLSVKYL